MELRPESSRPVTIQAKCMGVADVVPQPLLDVGENGLIESGRVPGSIFGCHKQKVSPTGDAFSYFVSGRQPCLLSCNCA